ncbi:terminase small subunit [Ochrobactrum sp. A-1]|uniref:terminase small subunit n=1 Tax=Ochrobactrum sp. A-1 TaxID=2920940 RepID=UPI001F0A1695|nr:terminase small subunit [Ochrobactrum sp. A-1]
MPKKNGGLTSMERAFVKVMADTNNAPYAAAKAGYRHPDSNGSVLMKKPAIAESVREKARQRLRNEGAEIGVRVLIEIATDAKQPAGARTTAATNLTKLSGIAVDDATQGKELHEMTGQELAAYRNQLERQRQLIDKAMSDAATPIIEGEVKTIDEPENDGAFG